MVFAKDKYSSNAMGGTEIMKYALAEKLDASLLDKFQIFVSRVHEELSEDHYRILWLQDLADDPENDHLKNNGWKKFHKLVFASNWQMRGFIEKFKIPWSMCVVIHNSINPIEAVEKPTDKINLIYHTTPHRGLEILYPVFDKLSKEHDNIHLDVYSSFNLYGWGDRDKPYQKLFDSLNAHEHISYHGAVSNEEVRKALQSAHIFTYPSIWSETSCLCLMEAMSAGLHCVHPNYGALPETASVWTFMYQMQDTHQQHAEMLYSILNGLITDLKNPENEKTYSNRVKAQKAYIDTFYNRDFWAVNWKNMLENIAAIAPDKTLNKSSGQMFSYKVG